MDIGSSMQIADTFEERQFRRCNGRDIESVTGRSKQLGGNMGEYVRGYKEAIKDVSDLIDKRESSMKNQSELNKKQQELLDDLKHVYSWQHSHAWDLFYYLVDKDTQIFEEETISNFYCLSEEESLKVLIIFSQWVLSPKE